MPRNRKKEFYLEFKPKVWRKMLIGIYIGKNISSTTELMGYQEILEEAEASWEIHSSFEKIGSPFKITEIFSHGIEPEIEEILEKKQLRHTRLPIKPDETEVNYKRKKWKFELALANVLNRRAIDYFFIPDFSDIISFQLPLLFEGRIITVNNGNLKKKDVNGQTIFYGNNGVLKTILSGSSTISASVCFLGKSKEEPVEIFTSDAIEINDFPMRKDYLIKKISKWTAEDLEEYSQELLAKKDENKELFLAVKSTTNLLVSSCYNTIVANVLVKLATGCYFRNYNGDKIYRKN